MAVPHVEQITVMGYPEVIQCNFEAIGHPVSEKKIFPKNKQKYSLKIQNSLERDPRYISTKFEVDLANGFREEAKNVIVDGRHRQMTMDHHPSYKFS